MYIKRGNFRMIIDEKQKEKLLADPNILKNSLIGMMDTLKWFRMRIIKHVCVKPDLGWSSLNDEWEHASHDEKLIWVSENVLNENDKESWDMIINDYLAMVKCLETTKNPKRAIELWRIYKSGRNN